MKAIKTISNTLKFGVVSTLLFTVGAARAQIGSGWTSMPIGGFIDYEVHRAHHRHDLTSFTLPSVYYDNSPPSETFGLTTSDSNRVEHDTASHYTSGSRQFQGDLQLYPGISNQSLVQIFDGTASGPIIMLKGYGANNGTLKKQGGSVVLATNCFARSLRVNVIHDLNANTIEVYIDGARVYSGGGGVGHSFNLKYGLYGSFVNVTQSMWSNVNMWQGGTSSGGCSPTPITPFLQVNGESWQQTDQVTINSGDSVAFGPQPTTGGSWSWSGPNGFSSTSRQVTVNNITSGGNYVATYVNSCGTSSSDTFVVTVNGGGDFTGTYQLQNVASGLSLNVSNGSTADGARIIQWPYSGAANELFTFMPTDSGYYQIVNVNSGKDIVVQGASTSQGANLIQWAFGSSGNDQWLPVQNSDGSYTFYNRNSGMVMDDPGSSTTQGTQMIQWGANGRSNQEWNLIAQ